MHDVKCVAGPSSILVQAASTSRGLAEATGRGAATAQPSPAQPSPAQPSPAQPSPGAQPSPAQPGVMPLGLYIYIIIALAAGKRTLAACTELLSSVTQNWMCRISTSQTELMIISYLKISL